MDALSVWVLSIVGVVVLGVLIDVIIPEGQTNKYIKSVFAIVTVFVIAAPIPKFINGDWSIDGIFAENPSQEVDSDYLNYLNDLKRAAVETDCIRAISDMGVSGAKVACDAAFSEGKIQIKQISVDLTNSVMSGENGHIDITGEIVSKISKLLNIPKEQVKVYGWKDHT